MDGLNTLDWSHLRSFAAVVEAGSLSGAARATGISQPTLSRHMSALETNLNARLFERSKAGVALTDKGTQLFEEASRMADAAARLAALAGDRPDKPEGSVRLTASRIVATYLLPEILTDLRQSFPGIEVELVASDNTENLLRREADIALRMYRPRQDDVIARHVGDLEMGAYAHRSYIERRGMPTSLDEILAHDLIGYDRSTVIIEGFAALGWSVDRHAFAFRSDDQVVCWQMALAGFGIGFNQHVIAERSPDMICVSGDTPVGRLPVWLTAHQEVRQSLRIRKVYDFLGEALSGLVRRP